MNFLATLVWNMETKQEKKRTTRWWFQFFSHLLLMEEILHHLGCNKPCKYWDKLPVNWCRISAINSIWGRLPFWLMFCQKGLGPQQTAKHKLEPFSSCILWISKSIYIYTVYIYIYTHTYNRCFFLQNPQVLPHFPKKSLLAKHGDLSNHHQLRDRSQDDLDVSVPADAPASEMSLLRPPVPSKPFLGRSERKAGASVMGWWREEIFFWWSGWWRASNIL